MNLAYVGKSRVRQRRVLVLDDDEDTLFAVASALQYASIEAVCVRLGEDAIQLARCDRDIDVFLLDVGLPDLDGWTVAKMIRSLGVTKPIYLITGWTNLAAQSFARVPSVDGVFTKPIQLETLLELAAR